MNDGYGASNIPVCHYQTDRFIITAGGGIVEVGRGPATPLDHITPAMGDLLSTSENGKDPWAENEDRRLYSATIAEGMAAALAGQRGNEQKTRITSTKLAASGYVNPFDVIAGASRPDIPLMTTNVRIVP